MIRCSGQSILNNSELQNSLDYSVTEIIIITIIIIIITLNSLLLLRGCSILVLVPKSQVVKRPSWKQESLKILDRNSKTDSILKMIRVFLLFLKMRTYKIKDKVNNLSFLVLPYQILIVNLYQIPTLQVEWYKYTIWPYIYYVYHYFSDISMYIKIHINTYQQLIYTFALW